MLCESVARSVSANCQVEQVLTLCAYVTTSDFDGNLLPSRALRAPTHFQYLGRVLNGMEIRGWKESWALDSFMSALSQSALPSQTRERRI